MKNVVIFIIGVAIGVAAFMLIAKKDKCDQGRTTHTAIVSNVELEAKELSRDVDSSGLEHVIYKESQPIEKLIEIKVEDRVKVDSLMEVVGIKDSQLKSITNAYGRVSAENMALKKKPRDTAFVYSDRYLRLSFQPKNDTLAIADFGYDFDFQSVSYDPRKWHEKIYKWDDATYTNIWSTDKRAKIRGYDKLTLKEERPEFGYTIKARSIYVPDLNLVSFGPAVIFRYKRINLGISYMRFPVYGDWYPTANLDIDLVGSR